ncbi:SHOCT domain-containing protein [Lacticaseibacillus manihotivorans]|uniref:SHOCT domain-containing protein n=1 Tax=Lacticaseibacillus manihotivorans TaxID=88233 RepID=A0A5P8JUT2_9LACO|nr:SHOCT domain-containing protein [Lacticaseibacillus manihotivorans]QFQ92500.1 hypothetical protein LM010_14250 [Lacticaseibacillus manihotivorans]
MKKEAFHEVEDWNRLLRCFCAFDLDWTGHSILVSHHCWNRTQRCYWCYYHQKQVTAAQAQAEARRQQATVEQQTLAATSKIDQIHQFKHLLDKGAITQAEFDEQKRKLLNDDDKLEF